MSSVVDEVWNDMKVKTRTFPSKVDILLFGSKQPRGKPKRSCPKQHTGASTTLTRYQQTPIKPSSALDNLTTASKGDRGGHHGPSPEPETSTGIALDLSRGTISADEIGRKLLADWLRYKNGVADSDVSIRKAALQSLSLGLRGVVNQYSTAAPTAIENNPDADPSNGDLKTFREDLIAILMDDLAKTIFKSLADPAEACRSAAICAVTTCVEHVADLTPYLAYLFPVIIARGVPSGSFYDPSLQLFVHDKDEHEAYKRGRATERQDLNISMVQRTPEDSEEIRLSLCQMVGGMVTALVNRNTIGVIGPYLDDIILFLVSHFNDLYSPVKVEALTILAKLAVHPQLEQGMKFYAVGLSRAFLPLLRHRHAKVRIAAIEALRVTVQVPDRAKVKGAGTAAIVDLVGFREDNVIPVAAFYGKGGTTVNYLAELATDINVSVRLKIAKMLSDWLTSLPDRYDHQTRLLPYVLHAIADDAENVSTVALKTVSQCGEEYEREHQNEVIERRQFGVDGDSRVNHAKPLPRPFSSRPRIGARLFVRGNARRFLLPLLVELSNWMSRTRLQSAKLLRTLIVYCEEHLTVETHKLIPYLQRALEAAIFTKDKPLENTLLECCELVGRYLVAESYLPHILARIREEPEVNPTGNRATLLTILSKLLEGSVPRVLIRHMPEVIDAMTARCQNIAAEPTPVRVASVRVLSVVAKSFKCVGRLSAEQATFDGTGRFISTERPMKSAVGYLLACKSLEDAPSIIQECLENFAGACHLGSKEMLVTTSAAHLVEEICENYPIGPLWDRKCYHQLLLEALLETRTCPSLSVPRTCPDILPPLLHLCEEILAKLSSFKESDREGVMMASVRFIILRAVQVWGCDRDTTSAYDETMNKHTRRILYLSTDACWDSTPALQYCQLEVLRALMESKAWGESLSDSAEASRTASNVMATLVGLLSNPDVTHRPEDRCRVLEYMAQILRDSVSKHGGELTPSGQLKRLIPFSRRNATEVVDQSRSLSGSPVVADAYRTVLARLGDTDDNVCRCALETLGEFLYYVEADVVGEQLQVQQSEITEADESTSRTVVTFSDFVTKCVSYMVHDMTCLSRESGDVLDTLLRRVASLDPREFEKIISRFSEDPVILTQPAMELLSQLIDHARVLSILEKQGS